MGLCKYTMMWIRNNQTDDCSAKYKQYKKNGYPNRKRGIAFLHVCCYELILLCLGNISLISYSTFSTSSSLEVDVETYRKHVVVTGVVRGVIDALVCTELNIL